MRRVEVNFVHLIPIHIHVQIVERCQVFVNNGWMRKHDLNSSAFWHCYVTYIDLLLY